ncbi:MAG: hypothetical protein ACK4YM_07460 [Novosphingobium sp.]
MARFRLIRGICLIAILTFFGGMLLVLVYLLAHSHRPRGDGQALLLGAGRAA